MSLEARIANCSFPVPHAVSSTSAECLKAAADLHRKMDLEKKNCPSASAAGIAHYRSERGRPQLTHRSQEVLLEHDSTEQRLDNARRIDEKCRALCQGRLRANSRSSFIYSIVL